MRKERRVFLMILCCLVLLGVVLALLAIGRGGWALYGVFLLCPLLHIFLMRGHGEPDRSRNPKDNPRLAQHKGKINIKHDRKDVTSEEKAREGASDHV